MGTQPLPSGYVLPKATNSDEYEERAALLTGAAVYAAEIGEEAAARELTDAALTADEIATQYAALERPSAESCRRMQ